MLAELLVQTDEVISPHSISYNCHRAVPYRARTKRVSYRVHTLIALRTVLEAQGKVKLNSKVAFRHFEKVNTPTPSTPGLQLTMKQKIIRNLLSKHRRHAYLLLFLKEREKRPEAEIIYWPELYKATRCCKFQLRFYVMKCELL